jgi:hypothetical protein
MKKPIVVSVIMAFIMLLGWSFFPPAHAQESTKEEKPTFYRLTPGVYVNGWPAFTLCYPKDWEVQRPVVYPYNEVFRVGAPRGGIDPSPILGISVYPNPLPLEKLTSVIVPILSQLGKDVKVVSDKPVQLKDGTPAQEAEFEWVISELDGVNVVKLNSLYLATTKDDVWISVGIIHDRGKIGEDLKSTLYSIKLQPGKEELVEVPPDAEQFMKEFGDDVASHDVKKVMTHYSDRYLNYGRDKQGEEGVWWQIFSVIAPNTTFYEASVTGFELQDDKAYVTGFFTDNDGKHPMGSSGVMIKEDGQWKWYGNQICYTSPFK